MAGGLRTQAPHTTRPTGKVAGHMTGAADEVRRESSHRDREEEEKMLRRREGGGAASGEPATTEAGRQEGVSFGDGGVRKSQPHPVLWLKG